MIDDADKNRGTVTTRIFKAYTRTDTVSGGYLNGQRIVLLRLGTPRITVPVGLALYMPDPARTAWTKAATTVRKQGVPPQHRPPQPARNPPYATQQALAFTLMAAFTRAHPALAVKMVLADALSATSPCMEPAAQRFSTHVLSHLRQHQNVRSRHRRISREQYFSPYPGVPQTVKIRGDEDVSVLGNRARLSVDAHHPKRFVIARTYADEPDSRDSVASELSWRTVDSVQGYPVRWRVEVFLEDWKSYEGWGQLTKQPDEDGSSHGLILSLRLAHCRRAHPQQLARLEHNRPAGTVGRLLAKPRVESLLACIRELRVADNPHEQLTRLSQAIAEVLQGAPSKKHRHTRDLGRLEPTPS